MLTDKLEVIRLTVEESIIGVIAIMIVVMLYALVEAVFRNSPDKVMLFHKIMGTMAVFFVLIEILFGNIFQMFGENSLAFVATFASTVALLNSVSDMLGVL